MKQIFAASLGLALAAALIAPPAARGAEVNPQISYVYFSVPYAPGLSATELILQHSPLSANGRRFSGYTRYNLRYEVQYSQTTIGVCRIDNPRVLCDCEITLPRLEGGESDPETSRQFAAELSRIKRHEQTHCDIAVSHGRNLLGIIRKMKDMPCGEADGIVAARLQEIMAACQVDQSRFDHSEYGYKDHLRALGVQRTTDAGFNIISPAEEGRGTGPTRDGRPGNLRSVGPPSAREFEQKGIYKDENGVWRNH